MVRDDLRRAVMDHLGPPGCARYLPQSRTERPDRCVDVGSPARSCPPNHRWLTAMITAAVDAGTPASRVAADEVCGADRTLRATLETRDVA